MLASATSESQPIVSVGMPRSGSTMLARMLNESPKHYVLNDLYALQIIDATNAWENFADRAAQLAFLEHLRKMIVVRTGLDSPAWIAHCSHLTQSQLDAVLERIEPHNVAFGNWAFTIEFVMQQIGAETGQIFWGWDTPQDHHHIDRIKAGFPRARILFLVRNPAAVLLSYKNQRKKSDADRYNVIAQSLAWRKAMRNYLRAKDKYGESVYLISYEDIVNDTKRSIDLINRFLSAEIPNDLDLASVGTNSSFRGGSGKPASNLTPFENWLSDIVLYQERKAVGYDNPRSHFSVGGIPEFLSNMMTFARSYSSAILQSRDARKRVYRLLRG